MENNNEIYQKNCCMLIHEGCIKKNLATIHQMTDKRIIAVLKENGYGMGLWNEYMILRQCGIDYFAVTNEAEAKTLRKFGWEGNILLLTPVLSLKSCIDLLDLNIIFMLGSKEQGEILLEAEKCTKLTPRVHIKIDTGFGRYGFYYSRLDSLWQYGKKFTVEGCYTHFGTSGRNVKKDIAKKVKRFQAALYEIERNGISVGITHVAASKVFSYMGDLGFDAVRLGSLLIGRGAYKCKYSFQDAVCLEAEVFLESTKRRGETVGYGKGITLKKDTKVGIVKVGHGDGVLVSYVDYQPSPWYLLCHRLIMRLQGQREKMYVTIKRKKVEILGKIGVGNLMVDLSEIEQEGGNRVRISINPLLVHPFVPRKIIGGEGNE